MGYPPVFNLKDSAQARAVLSDLRDFFFQKGHLAFSIDSLFADSIHTRAVAYVGPAMYWLSVHPADSASEFWFDAARIRPARWRGRVLEPAALAALQRQLLEAAENNGYPFAAVGLDSLMWDSTGAARAVVRVSLGRFFQFQTVELSGDLRLPKPYLRNYLAIRPGEPYSRARVLGLRRELEALPFAEVAGNPAVNFAGNEANLKVFLRKKRASRFDFLIGLLPRSAETGGSGLVVTGSASALFHNALNLGEQFSLEYDRLRPETQKLDVQARVPYLLGTPFGASGRLNIFRRDSTWVDAQYEFGIQYLFSGQDYLKTFWENRSLSLQQVDTFAIRETRRLPASLDQRQNSFGLEAARIRLDSRLNPRRGLALYMRTAAGFSRILRNNTIEGLVDSRDSSFRYASLYDTVATRAVRYRLEGRAEGYIPMFRSVALKLAVRVSGIVSDKPVYNNEQYRLGGNKLLRGFDEESLFATRWSVATTELRLLIGPNSFFSVFSDYAYLENTTVRTRAFLRPWGFGAGLNLETRGGIFGISLSVGRRDTGQAVDFRAAKFHLGYVGGW